MKKWEVLNRIKSQKAKVKINEIIKTLLGNRGIKIKKEIEEFLSPKLDTVTIESVGIDKKQLKELHISITKEKKDKP